MPTARLGSDPNGIVRNASQGFGGAARQAIVNAGEKLTNLNGGGSLDLSRRRLQSPKRAQRAVSEVRTVPANPFENTENSAPCTGVSVVSKGDNGGGGGIRTHGRLPYNGFRDRPDRPLRHPSTRSSLFDNFQSAFHYSEALGNAIVSEAVARLRTQMTGDKRGFAGSMRRP